MPKRRWVIYLFAILAILSATLILSHRVFRTNERIRSFVLGELRPILGEQFRIARVSLGLGTIHFYDVHVPFGNSATVLDIEDVRIGYNLYKAISTRFSPLSFTEDILVYKPRLTLAPPDSQPAARADTADVSDTFAISAEKQLANIRFLNRLSIREGELFLRIGDQDSLRIGTDLVGWIATESQDFLNARLAGKLFSSSVNNLYVEGKVDLIRNLLLTFRLSFSDYQLDTPLPEVVPESILIDSGVMSGELVASRGDSAGSALQLNGAIEIEDGGLSAADGRVRLENLFSVINIRNWDAFIDTCSLAINGAPGSIVGKISNVLNPQLDLSYRFNRINLKNALPFSEETDSRISGYASLNGSIQGHADQLKSRWALYSSGINVAGVKMKKVSGKGLLHRSGLFVESLTAKIFENQVAMQGSIKKSDKDFLLSGDVHAKGDIAGLVNPHIRKQADSIGTWLDAEISGKVANPVLYGSFGLNFSSSRTEDFSIRNAFSFQNKRFNSLPTLSKNGNLAVRSLVDFSDQEWNHQIEVKGAERIINILMDRPSWLLSDRIKIDLASEGSNKDISAQAHILRTCTKDVAEKVAFIDARLTQAETHLGGTGRLQFYPDQPKSSTAKFEFRKDAQSFRLLKFHLPDQLDLSFSLISINDSAPRIDGMIEMNRFNPLYLTTVPDSVASGLLSSRIKLSGTASEPNLIGFIEMEGGRLYNNGPYSGLVDFAFDSTGFKLNTMNVRSEETALFYASGTSDRGFKDMNFKVTGAGFDFGTITKSALPNDGLLQGKSLIDVSLQGHYKHPYLEGIVAFKDGRLWKFPFDNLTFHLGRGENGQKNSQSSAGVWVSDMVLSRENQFDINGQGFFPYDTNDSLHISVAGEGNFLSLLPDLTGYFKETESVGTLAIELKGTASNPEIGNASLQFDNGRILFGSVIPEVTQASMEIVFEPEDNFVHVINFSGLMGSEPFEISNGLVASDSAKENLEDFVFGDSYLNLGVFTLKSGENGIPLNIPGLMESGVYGRLKLEGKTEKEEFYFAGPVDRPHLRGRIRLNDTKIMFPFAEGAGKPNEVIATVLDNMLWDIAVVPEQDVRYIRSFPGAIDNVYVNLLIDQESELDFVGQMNDESLRVLGNVSSTTGLIEYLDMNFRIERAGAEFDNLSLIPVVFGKATTTVTDSLGVPTQIVLTAQTVDEAMELKAVDDRVRDQKSRGRWDQIRFRLSSDNPNLGNSETQILAALGYSAGSLQGTAFDAIGFGTDNILFRPIFKPVERTLEHYLGLDYVRFNSRLAKNIIDFNLNNNYQLNTRLALLRSTRVVVGKYLSNNLFFQYTGQIQAGLDYRYYEKGLGLNHQFGVEYHINPKLLLELEYNYDTLMRYNQEDKRIMLRHWFPF